jgi:hypothetical protein
MRSRGGTGRRKGFLRLRKAKRIPDSSGSTRPRRVEFAEAYGCPNAVLCALRRRRNPRSTRADAQGTQRNPIADIGEVGNPTRAEDTAYNFTPSNLAWGLLFI